MPEVVTESSLEAKKENITFLDMAKDYVLRIKDDPTYLEAATFLVKVGQRRKWWESKHEKTKADLYDAHKNFCAFIKEGEKPLVDAESLLRPAVNKYQTDNADRSADHVPVPKVDGLSFVDHWAFEVQDLKALVSAVDKGDVPMEAILPNMQVIRNMVRALKDQLKWPGVVVKKELIEKVKGGSNGTD